MAVPGAPLRTNPEDVFIDNTGMIYVLDVFNHLVLKLDSNGNLKSTWGGKGTENGKLFYPLGMSGTNNGIIYVADEFTHRIQKFSVLNLNTISNSSGSPAQLLH
ncbi:MAG: hypothetical protein HWD62_05300 [Cyclobacteriaceae bacterium]|nr:MAG: hypothetical protein HWD62_05300 [Cyclobacteriaceae bacterium]